MASSSSPHPTSSPHSLPPLPPPFAPVLSETTVYDRYVTVTDRTVALPPSNTPVSYDVVSHPRHADGRFVVVFPYTRTPEPSVTFIREFAQGPNALCFTLPAGGFEPAKHASAEAAGRAELAEEARLGGGAWESLLPPGHPGLPEVKWCGNRFLPLLCIDPTPLPAGAAPPRDAEECITEVRRVPLRELGDLLRSGDVLGPSFTTTWLALERLREMGEDV